MLAASLALSSCALLPSEFNLSPLYRHRLAKNGSVLEMDVLWPIFHYETTTDGGTDFRIRPFYRRVERPDKPGFGEKLADIEHGPVPRAMQQDHQFLWPLGRVRTFENEIHARLFPLWNYDSRRFIDGREESDWYFLFPFIWGGSDKASADAQRTHYVGIFPLYLDAPGEFLTYDRFTTVLWPLYTRTEKDGRVGHIFLWPFLGYGSKADEDQTYWYRFLPLFNFIARRDKFSRSAILWPILSWGLDNLDTDDPLSSFNIWPLLGWQSSEKIHAWSFLWPFFRGHKVEGKKSQLDLFWPIFRWVEDDTGGHDLKSWWFWPFISRTHSKIQRSWSVLWPIIWWREYDGADGRQNQEWVVPFYKHVHRGFQDGGEDDYLQIWPLFHTEKKRNGAAEWAFPSPWFYRDGNEEGVGEAYDWLYTIARSRTRRPDDSSFDLAANLYTTRTQGQRTQTSVPFLFSSVSEKGEGTFYLFNFIPIPFGSDDSVKAGENPDPSRSNPSPTDPSPANR